MPMGRGGDEAEGGFKVWLLKHGIHAARIRHLKLAIEIHLAIGRIGGAMQPFAAVGINAGGIHCKGVFQLADLAMECANLDMNLREFFTVQLNTLHGFGNKINPRVCPRFPCAEGDGGNRNESCVARGEIQLHMIIVHLNKACLVLPFQRVEVFPSHKVSFHS